MALLVTLTVSCPPALAPALGAALLELGAGCVEERRARRGAHLLVYGEEERALRDLGQRLDAALHARARADAAYGAVTWELSVDQDSTWDTAWTAHLEPIRLTPRVGWRPEGTPADPWGSEHPLVFRPALAFGDGAHVTTRLAALAVEQRCLAAPGQRVLDVGAGTGVLCFVAACSGAASVLGLEIDAAALRAAQLNARLNDLERRVQLSGEPLARVQGAFTLIVANLSAELLLALRAELLARLAPAAELVVTGLLTDRVEALLQAYLAAELGPPLTLLERTDRDGWALLRFCAAPEAGAPTPPSQGSGSLAPEARVAR